jgi:hypothetical protein
LINTKDPSPEPDPDLNNDISLAKSVTEKNREVTKSGESFGYRYVITGFNLQEQVYTSVRCPLSNAQKKCTGTILTLYPDLSPQWTRIQERKEKVFNTYKKIEGWTLLWKILPRKSFIEVGEKSYCIFRF